MRNVFVNTFDTRKLKEETESSSILHGKFDSDLEMDSTQPDKKENRLSDGFFL
jgi:hypothetical protein